MDLVGYDHARVRSDRRRVRARWRAQLGIPHVQCIPLSALKGDNMVAALASDAVVRRPGAARIPRHGGDRPRRQPTAASACRCSGCSAGSRDADRDFRGFAGTLVARQRERRATRSWCCRRAGARSVARVLGPDGALDRADRGRRRCMLRARGRDRHQPRRRDRRRRRCRRRSSDQFAAHVLWMGEGAAAAGPPVLAEDRHAHGRRDGQRDQAQGRRQHAGARWRPSTWSSTRSATATSRSTRRSRSSRTRSNRALGGFILIDRMTTRPSRPARSTSRCAAPATCTGSTSTSTSAARARSHGQAPRCVWFTGLSGSGKSTIANLVDKRLQALGHHTYHARRRQRAPRPQHATSGFTDEDRVENIRRVAEVAKLMVDAGLIVLVSFISPFRSERRMARALFGDGEFIEVFVDTPMAVAEARDVKGLYAKARAGQISATSPASIRRTKRRRRRSCELGTTAETPAEELAERVVALRPARREPIAQTQTPRRSGASAYRRREPPSGRRAASCCGRLPRGTAARSPRGSRSPRRAARLVTLSIPAM